MTAAACRRPGTQPGAIVHCSRQEYQPRPHQRVVGLPRERTMAASLTADIERQVITEAKLRKMTKGALLGRLLEIICDDNLFDAILGEP